MARVVLKHLDKTYPNGVHAVRDLNLEIADGELIVLVGPSGCGKSTTLRLIAGLEQPTSGEILIGDRVANDISPAKRNVAMVFQDYALYPHMTVRQNLAFGLKLRRTKADEIDRRVAVNLLPLSRKYRVRLDRDGDKEVTGRTAVDPVLSFIGQPEPHPSFDAGGNVDGQQPFFVNPLAPLAGLAGLGDDMAAPAAMVASPADAEESLLQADLA